MSKKSITPSGNGGNNRLAKDMIFVELLGPRDSAVRVSAKRYHGEIGVHIRKWMRPEGSKHPVPTMFGVTLRPAQLTQVIDALLEARVYLRDEGKPSVNN